MAHPLLHSLIMQEVPWARFMPAFLRELLSRNVMWILKDKNAKASEYRPQRPTLPFDYALIVVSCCMPNTACIACTAQRNTA